MGPALLGLLDDVAASSGYARGSTHGSILMETGIGVKPALTHIGNANVVGTSSRLDAEFTAVRQDKGRRLTGPSKLSVGGAMSPPRHHASSSWALGHGEHHVVVPRLDWMPSL